MAIERSGLRTSTIGFYIGINTEPPAYEENHMVYITVDASTISDSPVFTDAEKEEIYTLIYNNVAQAAVDIQASSTITPNTSFISGIEGRWQGGASL